MEPQIRTSSTFGRIVALPGKILRWLLTYLDSQNSIIVYRSDQESDSNPPPGL